ncbi:unnamed protein product [Peniophora sp. CBMAI 1063]|nr:unnamed protein product [Peniophora sp. CBMAI 1063]
MLSSARGRPFAESKPEDKAGDGLWEAYLDGVEDEDKAIVERWNGSTTGILTFTGLFAATVAAFVIESYKSLSPDTGAQTVALLAQLVAATNATTIIPATEILSEPFQVPETAVIVNALWFLSLVISLVCALLATLIQEWTRDYLRGTQWRTMSTTISQYAYKHIYIRMGVERYRLDRVASVIVGLMHLAVVLFLVGLAIFLFPIHFTTAMVVAVSSGTAAALTAHLHKPALLGVASPQPDVLCNCVTFPRTVWEYINDPAPGGGASILGFFRSIMFLATPSPAKEERRRVAFLNQTRLMFIWQRTGGYVLGSDGAASLLQYLPLRLVNLIAHELGLFFISMRWSKDIMEKIATSMMSLDSVSAAVGSVRLLQGLFQMDSTIDTMMAHGTDEEWRWENTELLLSSFPRIVERLEEVNAQARKEGDMSVLIAVSSFRRSLLLAWDKIRKIAEPDSNTMSQLRDLLTSLDKGKSLRLLPLSSEDLWISDKAPDMNASLGRDLASRNALTLLSHLIFTRFHGANGWQNPDSPYLRKTTPNMWHWHELFGVNHLGSSSEKELSVTTSPASSLLLTLLETAGLSTWTEPGSDFSAPDDVALPEVAMDALRHIACLVSFPPRSEQVLLSNSELEELGVLITPNPPTDTPPSSTEDKIDARAQSSPRLEGVLSLQHIKDDDPHGSPIQSSPSDQQPDSPVLSSAEQGMLETLVSPKESGVHVHESHGGPSGGESQAP